MIEIAAPICYRTCPVYQPGTSAPMYPIGVPTVVSIIILQWETSAQTFQSVIGHALCINLERLRRCIPSGCLRW